MTDINQIPKADIHVHLEGTISPAMVETLSKRNNIPVPPGLIDAQGNFHWEDDGTAPSALVGFLHAYDKATAVIKTAQDYTDITHDYLTRCAKEGCIYVELIISPDHGQMVGLSYVEMRDAIIEGFSKAKAETGIEARFSATCVRHYGPDSALKVAETVAAHPHPLVRGFGMAGDENAYTPADFAPAFERAQLPDRNAHACEAAGPASGRAARKALNIRRFGHMVRAIEDDAFMQEQIAINAVPEVCVSSNMSLKVYKDYKDHPLRRFFDLGLKVTLGSDDPTFFNTTIGREYQIARDKFGFTDAELVRITRNAIEEAFIDEPSRQKLLQKLDRLTGPQASAQQKPPAP